MRKIHPDKLLREDIGGWRLNVGIGSKSFDHQPPIGMSFEFFFCIPSLREIRVGMVKCKRYDYPGRVKCGMQSRWGNIGEFQLPHKSRQTPPIKCKLNPNPGASSGGTHHKDGWFFRLVIYDV